MIESCRALVAASRCAPERVVCRDRVVITFVTARVHTPLRCARYHGLRTMPVDTRRISYAADTQAAGIQPSSR